MVARKQSQDQSSPNPKQQEQGTYPNTKTNLHLSHNALQVLEKRYLLRNRDMDIIETPEQMLRRVARTVAQAETRYGMKDTSELAQRFYTMMADLDFLPNSPTLMNAGTPIGQLSACFVLPIEDSMEGIFTTLKNMALIHQSGGGTGFSFSTLRPEGDIIASTKCRSSGPVSFIRMYDTATDVVKQGGRRRGANMGVLRVDHPDILKFIMAKKDEGALSNFNLSVAVTDEFMKKASKGMEYALVNPRTGTAAGRLKAKDVLRHIATRAWSGGDPGIIFLDGINRHNPTPSLGNIESTNPCGEQPLLPYESCNLGSINLGRFVRGDAVDAQRLGDTVRLAVRFLDNVIDINKYPLNEIDEATKKTRKIGLGVMGFADMLIKMGVPYDSKQAVKLAGKVMSYIHETALEESGRIGKEKGSFPAFSKSRLSGRWKHMRNAAVTTIAPTGTISIIAGCSSGIEPLFGISFIRNVLDGARLLEVNTDFESMAKAKGFHSKELMQHIAKTGSLKANKKVPRAVRKLFVTALDIGPEWHVRIQAEFQKHTDGAVSKTINFPSSAKIDDIENAFKLAFKLKCKGITSYRDGSIKGQALSFNTTTGSKTLTADAEYSGGCFTHECPF